MLGNSTCVKRHQHHTVDLKTKPFRQLEEIVTYDETQLYSFVYFMLSLFRHIHTFAEGPVFHHRISYITDKGIMY